MRGRVSRRARHGTDIAALDEHCIAVTPLKLDMTDEPYHDEARRVV